MLALAGPSRLLEVVAPDRASRHHAKRRIETAIDLTPVTPIAKKVIAEMQAAAGAAAMLARWRFLSCQQPAPARMLATVNPSASITGLHEVAAPDVLPGPSGRPTPPATAS